VTGADARTGFGIGGGTLIATGGAGIEGGATTVADPLSLTAATTIAAIAARAA
jgi:hypothetical protein